MIEYLPGGAPRGSADQAPDVEFVDGPWASRRERMSDPPSSIGAAGGSYLRSVRCADDGALRYVFVADPEHTDPRSIQPA
jgi:hypothetical protein